MSADWKPARIVSAGEHLPECLPFEPPAEPVRPVWIPWPTAVAAVPLLILLVPAVGSLLRGRTRPASV